MDTSRSIPAVMRSTSTPSRRTLVKGLAGAAGVAALAGSARAQESGSAGEVTVQAAIAYAKFDGKDLLLDVYTPPAREAPRPAMVLTHPGGFAVGDRTWMSEFASGLAEAGYVAFSIDYRLFAESNERTRWPGPLDDAQRAVRWARANAETYGVDPERIGSLGYSSGGLLAAQLGARDKLDSSDPELADHSSRVACVVDVAGDADAAIPWPDPADEVHYAAFIGGKAQEAPQAYRDFAAPTHIDAETAPFLVLHGANDSVNPIEHAWRLVKALHEAGVEVVYGEFADIDHRDWTWADVGPWALPFLERQLDPNR